MKKSTDIILQNKVFIWIALATALILMVPFMAMLLKWQIPDPGSSSSGGVNWSVADFIVMGTLLFSAGSIFVLVARVTAKKYRALIGAGILAVFLWLWIELAVGLFTNWGS